MRRSALALAVLLTGSALAQDGAVSFTEKVLATLPADQVASDFAFDARTMKLAFRVRPPRGAENAIWIDGKSSPTYHRVDPPILSPDGRRVAYRAKLDEKNQVVVVDGTPGESWDQVGDLGLGGPGDVAFSDDGRRVGYAGRKGEEWFAVVDGVRSGPYAKVGREVPLADGPADLAFSPGGKRVAFRATKDGRAVIVVDGVAGEGFDWVGFPVFSVEGLVAYWANVGGRVERYGTTKDVGGGWTLYSSGGLYAAVVGGEWFVVAGDRKLGPYERAAQPAWTADGKTVYFAARKGGKELVVVGDREEPTFDSIGPPVASADGARAAYWAAEGGSAVLFGDRKTVQNGKMFVVAGGEKGEAFDEVHGPPVVSADGSVVAYRAAIGAEWYVVVGRDRGRAYTGGHPNPAVGPPAIAPDGRSVVHTAIVDEVEHVVVRRGDETEIRHGGSFDVRFGEDGAPAFARGDATILGALALAKGSRTLSPVHRSPDGRKAGVLTLEDGKALWRVVDLASLPIGSFVVAQGGRHDLKALAATPDGALLVGGTSGRRVEVYDGRTFAPVKILEGHGAFIEQVAIAGERVVSSSQGSDRSIRAWDLGEGSEVARIEAQASRLVLSKDGRKVGAVAEGKMVVWEIPSGKELARIQGYPMAWGFAADGRRITAVVRDGRAIAAKEWSLPDGKEGKSVPLEVEERAAESSLVLSSDLECAATALRDYQSGEVSIAVVGLAKGKPIGTARAKTSDDPVIALSPDGSRVAVGSRKDATVTVLDVKRGREVAVLSAAPADPNRPLGLAFTAGGDRLVAWNTGGRIVVWDLKR